MRAQIMVHSRTNTASTDDHAASLGLGRSRRCRRWVRRLVAAVLVPAMFFCLLEVGLRIGGYGHDTAFLTPVDDAASAYTSNRRFGWRFFPRSLNRRATMIRIPAQKSANTVRIFLLGGSAIRGEPEAAFSAGRFLTAMLEQAYPASRFEVINTAMTAINSHVVLPIARSCAGVDPDIFIIYMGNNEVVGPFGVGTMLTSSPSSLSLIRTSLWLNTTRTGQLVGRLLAGKEDAPAQWRGMEMFLEHQLRADDPQLQTVYRHFRENLRDIVDVALDAGATVVVSTVAVNTADCPPFGSANRLGLSRDQMHAWNGAYQRGLAAYGENDYDTAARQFARAAEIDDTYAELRYDLGRCLDLQGRPDAAYEHFVSARDWDTLRFRADRQINDAIRHIAHDADPQRVFLVDAEALLAARPPDSIQQRDAGLFYEHVHLRPEGNYALAAALFPAVVRALPASVRQQDPTPVIATFSDCQARLALTDWDRYTMLEKIRAITAGPPFTNRFDADHRRRTFDAECDRLARRLAATGSSPSLRQYEHAIQQRPEDIFLHARFAKLLLAVGQSERAIEHCRHVLAKLPSEPEMTLNLAAAFAQAERWPEAQAAFEEYLTENRDAPPAELAEACRAAAAECVRANRIDDALAYCNQAMAFLPNDSKSLIQIGRIRRARHAFTDAVSAFQSAVDHAPPDSPLLTEARRELASLLLQLGRDDEALDYLAPAVTADPTDVDTIAQMASALTDLGRLEQALTSYTRAVELAPQRADLRCRYADALQLVGQGSKAAMQYEQVLKRQPAHPDALNGLAWLLATTPEGSLRDGRRAVALARKSAEVQTPTPPTVLDTLAAAYAAAGDFDQAIAVAQQAHALALRTEQHALAEQTAERLALYRQAKPFLQPTSRGP